MKPKKGTKQQTSISQKPETSSVENPIVENWVFPVLILLLTFLIYLPVLSNGLINWDDNVYIRDNPLIYSINLKQIFSNTVSANYHPLTILVLAIEYHFFKLNETGYHAVNLVLHLLNVVLVIKAIYLLCGNRKAALVTGFLFGIHPMHVESVAWAAELKDLLYTFFFLLSWIYYMKFKSTGKRGLYFISVFLFLLSLLSKAMAASLPLVLLLTDYFIGRKFDLKNLLEKLPYFLLALIFGILAVKVQQSAGATEMVVFPFTDRIVYASTGFINYLIKLLVPLNLSAYYPYPVNPGTAVPGLYYLYLLAVLLILALIFTSLRKTKVVFFGFGFFIITIFLVLQVLPVGRVIMADRYSYIPSIGIFYLAGLGFDYLWSRRSWILGLSLLLVFGTFFSWKTFTRSEIWRSSLTLWSDVIRQYQTVPAAYNNRSLAYKSDKKFNEALADVNKAIQLDPKYGEAYINRGNIYRDMNRLDEALTDYGQAIELLPYFEKAYVNRGILLLFANRNDDALADFDKAIRLKPDYSESHYHRGLAFYNLKRYDEAISSYTKAISFRPGYAEAWYSRGVSKYYANQKDAACKDIRQSASLGYKVPPEVNNLICK